MRKICSDNRDHFNHARPLDKLSLVATAAPHWRISQCVALSTQLGSLCVRQRTGPLGSARGGSCSLSGTPRLPSATCPSVSPRRWECPRPRASLFRNLPLSGHFARDESSLTRQFRVAMGALLLKRHRIRRDPLWPASRSRRLIECRGSMLFNRELAHCAVYYFAPKALPGQRIDGRLVSMTLP
jgi:hypothetical protein